MLHNKKNFINRVSKFMVNDTIINITLNSQIEYWKGQKKTISFPFFVGCLIAPTGEEYPYFRAFTLNKIKPYSIIAIWRFRSRTGLGMNPREESGTTRQIQTGSIINPNNAPPKVGTNSKINVLQRKFKFYITTLLQTFAETLQIIEMSTLSQQGERSNAHVYSTD